MSSETLKVFNRTLQCQYHAQAKKNYYSPVQIREYPTPLMFKFRDYTSSNPECWPSSFLEEQFATSLGVHKHFSGVMRQFGPETDSDRRQIRPKI